MCVCVGGCAHAREHVQAGSWIHACSLLLQHN